MLDDLKLIHIRDSQDALGIVGKAAHHLALPLSVANEQQYTDIRSIVVGGMGGSALPALLAQPILNMPAPLEVVRGYDIPAYVDSHTLFIASSYSGNTEETMTMLDQAEARGAEVCVLTSGGELQKRAESRGYMMVQLPQVTQPRYAIFYGIHALLVLLHAAGMISETPETLLHSAINLLGDAADQWRPDKATAQSQAKQLAQELIGKSIVMYAGPKLFPAAYAWKTNINENAKQLAWASQLPEASHNEFIGWTKQPVSKPYAVVELRSNLENAHVGQQFAVTERLLSGTRPSPLVIEPQGSSIVEQLLWSVLLGEFVSIYLALLNGLDPTPIELVSELKRRMSGPKLV